jgi:hypothetical protein
MKRTTKLIVAAVAIGAVMTGVAVAASSPTVVTRAATRISNFGARLNATVNPNGIRTGYSFQYGLTTAYGLSTRGRSAGRGTKPVTVGAGVSGLTPGTVYHYRIVALNRAGASLGADHTFKTTGPPPAGVVTGPPISVGKTTATVSGTVTTNGAATTYLVQYGQTTSYGQQTFGKEIPNSPSPTAVSVPLSLLPPRTLIHYRLVGIHGSKVASYGSDATLFTEPIHRPKPRLSTRTSPKRDRHSPFVFTTGGTLHGATFIPASVRCTGSATVSYFRGRHRMRSLLVLVGPDCKFTATTRFHHIKGHGPREVRIAIHFRGNGYIAPVSRTNRVTVG